MPYAREKFSSWWIVLWTVFFFGGMIFIFSFLLGNPFFSGEITGKYVFSSASANSSLFMDEEFLGKGSSSGNVPLGKKELCVREYFFVSRCFDEEVRSNAFSILEKKSITLFPRNFRVDTLTKNSVYFDPAHGGVFWFDFDKNVIWGIKKDTDSFFSQRIPFAISPENISVKYDNIEGKFRVNSLRVEEIATDEYNKFSEEKEKKDEVFVVFPESFITFDEVKKTFFHKNEKIEFLKSSIIKKAKNSEISLLLASFSQPAQKIYSYNTNKILEFPESVWIFTPEKYSFQKILSKQPNTRIFWHKKTSSIFYQEDNVLKRLYLK